MEVMSDEKLDKIIASQARTEVHVQVIRRDFDTLKTDTNARMRSHAAGLRSLNRTRDRQWGAAKVLSCLGAVLLVVVGWFSYA